MASTQTILSNKQSTYGSPYCYYTVTAYPYSRSASSCTITITIKANLGSSDSWLGTGHILIATIAIGSKSYDIDLKGYSDVWEGTAVHTTTKDISINELSSTQTSLTDVKFSVVNTYGNSSTLSSTSCSNITIDTGNSISDYYIKDELYLGEETTISIFPVTSSNYHNIYVSYGSHSNNIANNISTLYTFSFSSYYATWFSSTEKEIHVTFNLATYSSSGTLIGNLTRKIKLILPRKDYKPTGHSGTLSSQSDSTCTITLTRPTFKNSATFSSWNVSKTIGSSFVSGDKVTISGLSSVSNETGVLTVTCTDSRGIVSDPIYVQYHLRKEGLCVYNGSVYVPATSYLYSSKWGQASGYSWNGSSYVK